jgi:hypothetical protein
MKRNTTCFASFSHVFAKQTHHFFRFFSHLFASIFFAVSQRLFRFISKNNFFHYFATTFSLQNPFFSFLLRLFRFGHTFSANQCCGSGRILTGSGSDFRKRLDPDPDHNKFSANFFLKFFLWKYALKSIFMNQKVKQQRFLKYLWLLNILKKLRYGHLLGPGSGSDQKGPDPTRSGSATLLLIMRVNMWMTHLKKNSTTFRPFFFINLPLNFPAANIFRRPLLCFLAEISASWQHCIGEKFFCLNFICIV